MVQPMLGTPYVLMVCVLFTESAMLWRGIRVL